MRRPEEFLNVRWDDPFWHAVRMVVDETRSRVLTEEEISVALGRSNTTATTGLLAYLESRPAVLRRVADYLAFRESAADRLLQLTRTEAQALSDFGELSEAVVQKYGTRSTDHHQSSKVLVATVEVLTRGICVESGFDPDVNPQKRAALVSDSYIWVSPRRLDGALPSLLNPVALWEIKEYWGSTSGGSKMSDAIYECQLVGLELRAFEDTYGPQVRHYALLDGRQQWMSRRSDLRRAVDLLCAGLIDELLVGTEVLDEWPRIVRELCALAKVGKVPTPFPRTIPKSRVDAIPPMLHSQ